MRIPPDENILQLASNKLLSLAATGEIDLNKLASEELKDRGLDDLGKWQGFSGDRKSIIKWRGGKSRLAKKILEFFPKHVCYIEPFCGACWLLFSKDEADSKHEVINDLHGELINFWKVIRDDYKRFWNAVKYDIPSRELYNEMRFANLMAADEITRARHFYWLSKGAFGGGYGDVFGTSKVTDNCLKFHTLKKRVYLGFKRLKKVTIENLDYTKLFKIYDSKDTFWYVDPPYLNTNKSGYAGDIDLNEFVDYFKSLKGKVAISHNDCEEMRASFGDWNIHNLGKRQNSICNNSGGNNFSVELLITNY